MNTKNKQITKPISNKLMPTKFMPLVLSLLAVAVGGAVIAKNEMQLANSQAIYIELRPVDPRSLLQGDYMQLRYNLNLANAWSEKDESEQQKQQRQEQFENQQTAIENKHKLLAYVQLDKNKVLTSVNLQGKDSKHNQPLVIKNPTNYSNDLYVASKTFLFAEGLADCYAQSKYAKIMVDSQGNAILGSLVGEDLADLGCEKKLQ